MCALPVQAWQKPEVIVDGIIEDIAEELAGNGQYDYAEELHDRLSYLSRNPVNVNTATRRELERCGLLDQYRIASLLDYRERTGDILSVKELSMIPGFNGGFAEMLSGFVVFNPDSSPVQEWDGDAMLRLKYRPGSDGGMYRGYRIRVSSPSGVSGGMALRGSFLNPEKFSANIRYRRGNSIDVIAGDFNARFGQGSLVWTSMTMRTLLPSSMLMRTAWGITPSCSVGDGGNLHGLAVTCTSGAADAGAFLTHSGGSLGGGANVTVNLRKASAGFTSCCHDGKWGVAVDGRLQLGRTSVFSEAAFSGGPGIWGGAESPVSEDWSMSVLARYASPDFVGPFSSPYSTDTSEGNECALTVAFRRKRDFVPDFIAGADFAWFPEPKSSAGAWQLRLKSDIDKDGYRVVPSFSAYGNGDLKASVRCSWDWGMPSDVNVSGFSGSVRGDISFFSPSPGMGRSVSATAGYRVAGRYSHILTVYAGVSVFHCDRWDERIYVYERDLHGSVSVPALYGRGFSSYILFSWKPVRGLSLTLKVSVMRAGRMYAEIQKAGYTDLKFQCVYSL